MKKIGLIIVVLVSICAVNAQERMSVQNIALSAPVMDSLRINPYLNFCGVVRKLDLNCLDNEFAQKANKIWKKQIKIQSESAKEIEIVFQKFILSSNAIVSFYTDDSLQYKIQGAYFVHKPDSSYISHFLRGDYCTIVIEIPTEELDKNQILISRIRHFTESFDDAIRGTDYSCMIDINCPEGNDWCDQRRSVALYYFEQDGELHRCTGALVNNHQNDFTQYFLTARHCTNGDIDWAAVTFYFNYQNSYCNSGDAQDPTLNGSHYGVQGAQLIAYSVVSWGDNALLLITDPIPTQYNIYYAGVDITDRSMGDKVTCIHHSSHKPKKIVSGHLQHFAGPKWEMYWDNGMISGGGSGAPIFLNSNKRVIATVSGGFKNLDCTNNLKQEWVGKVKACNDIIDVLFGDGDLDSYDGIDPIKACQSTLNLQGEFYKTQEYDATLNGLTIQAGNTITVSNAIFYWDANFTLTAGNKIVFKPGTNIKYGANVTAKIAPCSGNLVLCGTHSSKQKSMVNSSQEYSEEENTKTITEIQEKSNDITLHPNPNTGTFTIKTNLDPQEIVSIRVLTPLGLVLYEQAGLPSNGIQMPSSAKGLFWVEVNTTTQRFIRKMVVQ